MTAPKLLFAGANGQSSVRAIFDQPMRELGATAAEDPENPANWTPGGGLPAITSVVRTSNIEFELILASPMPIAAGYTVTVAITCQAAATGEEMDPGFLTPASFAATVPDLVVSSVSWLTAFEVNVIFSEPIAQIMFDEFNEVAQFLSADLSAREPTVIGISQTGASFRIQLANAGTSGARYTVKLNREVFVSDATNTTLLLGEEEQLAWGQGEAPAIAALSVKEDEVQITSSEVLGKFPDVSGWPLSHGLYDSDIGSLGPSTPLELGSSDAVLVAPGASFKGLVGDTATVFIKKTLRTVVAGDSWTAVATSVLGAGSETVGGSTTTLNKTAGAPFEIVFSGGTDSLSRAGRKLSTTMDVTFTGGATSFPLAVFTLLNTQASVVIEKTVTDMAVLKLYRGNQDLLLTSTEFDPTTAFTFDIIDATSDNNGWLSVAVDGVVLLGAESSDILDDNLIGTNVGATAVAVTLGSPAAPAEVFSIEFSTDLVAQTYLGTGLMGFDSKDLFSFPLSSSSTTVAAAVSPPLSGGYEDTGKGAFGVHAEYKPTVGKNAIDAIQVVIGLNEEAQPLQFTGSATLLTGDEKPMDQVLMDETYVLVGGEEIIVVFLNPTCWSGVLVSVALDIGGVDYSVTVPVTMLGEPIVRGSLDAQPSKWYHQRLSNNVGGGNSADFGPAVIVGTP